MSKPEVVAWMVSGLSQVTMHEVAVMDWDDEGEEVESLIRLTDHETARAADKARIAELTEALKSAREMVSDWGAYASEYFREKHGLEKDLAELDATIDAALAQQGKE